MRRWSPAAWPEALKTRAARYALERSLGPFLEERLRLEQLSLDLRGGTGCLRHLRLRAEALDAALRAPLELREGCVGSVQVSVPWAALASRACSVRLRGLRLALRPRAGGVEDAAPPPDGGHVPPPAPRIRPPRGAGGARTDHRLSSEEAASGAGGRGAGAGAAGGARGAEAAEGGIRGRGGAGRGPPPVLLKGLRLWDPSIFWQESPPPGTRRSPPVRVGFSPGPSRLSLRLKQNPALPGPKVDVEASGGGAVPGAAPPAAGGPAGAAGGDRPP
ncbi:autophagy-related protein 2 homolog A-like, partial [Phaenicophaeus curvirostris]|uniref:autophagy-related protein 2 homolog A-like n=1 Tax=Phaenicophaeus curvirostris TaxID=33595 RepID=UPI0037F0C9DE